MSNETNIVPLVDILSDQKNEQVVMNNDKYVFLSNKQNVNEDDIITAIEEQNRLISIELIKSFSSKTDAHIQAEVMKYNEANNVMFGSIHNCSTYITVDTYPHQAFCIAIIKWNAKIWETVRAIITLPTDEEFQAVLDSVPFNG